MIAAWMVYALVVGGLVALAAAGVEAVLRLAGAPLRWVWAGALLLTLGLTAAAPARMLPAPLPLELPMVEATAAGHGPALAEPTVAAALAGMGSGAVSRLRDALSAAGRRVPEKTAGYLLVAWAVASLIVLATIGATHRRFRRARRGWPSAELLGTRVRLAPEVGPAVMGVARPEIVVPRWFLELSPAESRLVLTHESEHVRARDPLLLALAWTIAALLAWNPAAWWMLARLRLAVEYDCDARVLRRGESARSYGSVLIDLAGRSSRLPVGMLALADPPSQLERRLLAMTYRRTRSALARGCALGALALLALGAACAAELPTAAEIQAVDVAAAEAAGSRVALLDDGHGNTVYRLDGVIVTREEALALASEKIASVGVVRARTPGGQSEVAILTRKAGEPVRTPDGAVGFGGPVRIRTAGPQGPEPVYLVDGVLQASPPFGRVAPLAIESIHVIKDRDAAVKLAGPDAVNGLIVIRTKGGKPDGLDLDGLATPAPMRVRVDAEPNTIVRTPAGPSPVYFIDGVRASAAAFRALDPTTIESVNVTKDTEAAIRLAGPEGVNGVVEVRTRSAAPE